MFLARSEMGDVPYEMEPVDVRSILEQVVRRSSALARLNGIEIDFLLSSGTQDGAAVNGDLRRLRQLFVILIDNALKYTQPGGKLEITTTAASGMVVTHFSDTGIGISSEDLALVFGRFYRAGDERVRARQGTGLGLPIAKSIAQVHGGKIAIASELGEGTTVSVVLPRFAQVAGA